MAMTNRLKATGWVGLGLIGGVALSLGISAVAQREGRLALPVEELRQFADSPKVSAVQVFDVMAGVALSPAGAPPSLTLDTLPRLAEPLG